MWLAARMARTALEAGMSPKRNAEAWAAYFQLELDVPEIRNRLRQPLPPTAPALAEVMGAFLGVAIEFDGIPARRSPFHVPAGLEQIFCLLVNCGYVERVDDDLVKWSEQVAPQMQAIYVWEKPAKS